MSVHVFFIAVLIDRALSHLPARLSGKVGLSIKRWKAGHLPNLQTMVTQ